MVAAAHPAALKLVGSNGQISLGKQYRPPCVGGMAWSVSHGPADAGLQDTLMRLGHGEP